MFGAAVSWAAQAGSRRSISIFGRRANSVVTIRRRRMPAISMEATNASTIPIGKSRSAGVAATGASLSVAAGPLFALESSGAGTLAAGCSGSPFGLAVSACGAAAAAGAAVIFEGSGQAKPPVVAWGWGWESGQGAGAAAAVAPACPFALLGSSVLLPGLLAAFGLPRDACWPAVCGL